MGLFKNPGRTWRKEPIDVLDHDFPSLAEGRAIPFGIYNQLWRTGFVVVGTSNETAEFAGAALSCWWEDQGRWRCPKARRWFIEADGGGANSSRTWAWKWVLQQLADRWGVSITVAHYPPGASKWNPIEHRLFSRISANWEGEPLKDYETIVGFISNTTSSTGLRCRAVWARLLAARSGRVPATRMNLYLDDDSAKALLAILLRRAGPKERIDMAAITVHLNDDLTEEIRRLAAAQARSETDIVCEALDAYVRTARPLPKGIGKYHSGAGNVSEQARDLIRQAVKQRQWP